jgi:hypothetical protein
VAALLVPVVVSVSLVVDIFLERGGLVVLLEFRTHFCVGYLFKELGEGRRRYYGYLGRIERKQE